MSENGIATIADLQGAGLHRVTLPGCEKPVLLRELSTLQMLADPDRFFPASLAGRMVAGQDTEAIAAAMTPEQRADAARITIFKVCAVFAEPKAELRFEGGQWHEVPGMLNPLCLPAAAQDWLEKYVRGEIDHAGNSVAGFPGKPGVPGDVSRGPDVRAASEHAT